MNKVLAALCIFTILASAWMFTMFLVLRHPGFVRGAILCLLIIGQGVITLIALRSGPALPLKVVVGLGALGILALAASAIIQNNLPSNTDSDGYVDVIGLALIAQGLLTLWGFLRRRPVSPGA